MSSPLPVGALSVWCRAIHHGLGAGLSPVKLLKMQAKSGPGPLREVSAEMAARMAKGTSFRDALEPHRGRFPPVFTELVDAGEQSGRLEEVFEELAAYFENSRQTRQEFLRLLAYPAMQAGAAVLVIALLIFILGFFAGKDGRPATDVLGLGLTGTTGAVLFLAVMAAIGVGCVLLYRQVANNVAQRAKIEAFALMVPGWGPAVLAFALHRFAVALRITHEAGLPAERVVGFALRATANAAFTTREPAIVAKVKRGGEITPALAQSGAPFPEEFVASLGLAEETGQITEVLERVAESSREDGIRKLKLATQLTGYAIYALVGLMIVIAIFRIASIYLAMLG